MNNNKIYFLLAMMLMLSSCINITNENKAINGNNEEGGNSYTRENYEYRHNEYSEQNTRSYNTSSHNTHSSGIGNATSCYTGTIGTSRVTMYINPSITSGKIGYYYYDAYKKNISLYVDSYDYYGDDMIEFVLSEETAGYGKTGSFRVTVYPSHTISGSFVNSKGQSFSVNLD